MGADATYAPGPLVELNNVRSPMFRTVVVLVALGCALSAQEYRSTLTGVVTDSTGAALPNVKVRAVKTNTDTRFETVSTNEGVYTLPFLPPGSYQISAEATGFKAYVQSGLEIGVDARVAQDIRMTVGDSKDSVTIVANATALETATASSGQAFTTHEVETLPLNGRAASALAVIGYGVVDTGARDQNRPFENGGLSDFSMGGMPHGANMALLDGVPDMGTLGGQGASGSGAYLGYNPPIDATEEVKVEIVNVDASYGGSAGGTVEMTTRGGTNALHGSAYEYNENQALAATPFFNNASKLGKAVFRQNFWGGAIGGPLFIPKVLDGRNKVFFFFAYEAEKDAQPSPSYFTVPTAAEVGGDFSRLLSLNNGQKNYTLYDPGTGTLSNGVVVRQPFPGNVIPATRLNPIATKFLTTYMPAPNTVGSYDDTNNYVMVEKATDSYHNFSGRMDVNLSSKNRLTFRGNASDYIAGNSNMVENPAYIINNVYRDLWAGMIDDVQTFSPTIVGDLRLGFNRYQPYTQPGSVGYDPTNLGFPSYIRQNSSYLLMPIFAFSDGYASNGPYTASSQPYNTYQLYNAYSFARGAHLMKAGFQITEHDFSSVINQGSTGQFNFNSGSWVNANTNAASPTLGGSMAEFLLGLPTSGSYTINYPSKDDSRYYAFFFTDDWRIRPNLTLNMGIRWEYSTPTTESYNRQETGFDANAVNSVSQAAATAYAANPVSQLPASAFKSTGGLLFATSGQRAAYTSSKKQVAPRLGISWAPTALHNRTIIRASAGIFYYDFGVQPSLQPGYSASTPYVATSNNYLTPATTLSNPFPSGIQLPAGSSQGINTFLGQSITFYNPHLPAQYSARWSFDIQQQLPSDTTLQIGYIGNHAVHLTTSFDYGALPAQYLSTSPFRDNATIAALNAQVANPYAGLLPGTGINSAQTSLASVLSAFGEFGSVTELNMTNGGSYYDALDMKIQKRLSTGLQFVVNYGYSRLMDENSYLNSGSLRLAKKVSNWDRPHNLVITSTYNLPFGHGKRYLTKTNAVADLLLGNWVLGGIYNYHSGAPLNWGNVIYNGGPLNYDSANVGHAFDTTRFNTISSQQLTANYRTFPAMFSNLRINATNNLNVGLTKSFHIHESARMELRAQAYNFCNHPLFGTPNLSPTSSTFGKITRQSNNPRIVEVGLHLRF